MLLHNKNAVIYGAGGAIGGAVARAFAREGAKVYLTGRHPGPVEAVAKDIGSAEVAVVDTLDERAIERHLQSIGRVDISLNAIGLPNADIVGVPLTDLDVDKFLMPIASYTRSYFLTARLAARLMVPNKSGVIMSLSAVPARTGTPMNGGYAPAVAAKEALTRSLSAELAQHGVRVVTLRPHAIPESQSIQDVFNLKAAKVMTWDQWQKAVASTTHTRRLTTLEELANVAAFVASDQGSGLTGTTVNLTMGALDD